MILYILFANLPMSELRSQQEKETSEIEEDLDELYPNVVKNKLESVRKIL